MQWNYWFNHIWTKHWFGLKAQRWSNISKNTQHCARLQSSEWVHPGWLIYEQTYSGWSLLCCLMPQKKPQTEHVLCNPACTRKTLQLHAVKGLGHRGRPMRTKTVKTGSVVSNDKRQSWHVCAWLGSEEDKKGLEQPQAHVTHKHTHNINTRRYTN